METFNIIVEFAQMEKRILKEFSKFESWWKGKKFLLCFDEEILRGIFICLRTI